MMAAAEAIMYKADIEGISRRYQEPERGSGKHTRGGKGPRPDYPAYYRYREKQASTTSLTKAWQNITGVEYSGSSGVISRLNWRIYREKIVSKKKSDCCQIQCRRTIPSFASARYCTPHEQP
jgi:hypothetical protein